MHVETNITEVVRYARLRLQFLRSASILRESSSGKIANITNLMTACLKVLHVAETAKGGVGTYIDDVASLQLAQRGDPFIRVVLPDAHATQLQRVPLAVQRRFKAADNRLANTVGMVRAAMQQVREWEPDVVHLHSTFAGFALRPLLAMRSHRPRIVYCSHGWAFDREGHANANRLFKWIERVWSRWCDAVVCVSSHECAAAEQIGIDRKRLVLVNNGVRDVAPPPAENPALAAWPAGMRRVLFVGRLDRQKGVDVLFEAMRRLHDTAFAVIVGAPVVAGGALTGMPANVRIAGWLGRDEIAAYYAAAEVMVIPSRWEAFSLVAVEAMRAGCAVVATAVGGLRDVVVDEVTGHLVAPEDAAGLAACIASLSASDIADMGRAGRERFERHFRIERVVEELEAIYRAAVSQVRAEIPASAEGY